MAIALHCNLKPPDVAPVVLGCFFGQICTAHAQKLLFPSFRSKFWHRCWIRRPWFRIWYRNFGNQWIFVTISAIFSLRMRRLRCFHASRQNSHSWGSYLNQIWGIDNFLCQSLPH